MIRKYGVVSHHNGVLVISTDRTSGLCPDRFQTDSRTTSTYGNLIRYPTISNLLDFRYPNR